MQVSITFVKIYDRMIIKMVVGSCLVGITTDNLLYFAFFFFCTLNCLCSLKF